MRTAFSITVVALLMFAISCNDGGAISDSSSVLQSDLGSMLLKFNSAPPEITTVIATLSRMGTPNRTLQLSVTDSGASGSFYEVPVGRWHLRIDARDSAQVVRYSGETDVDVHPGATSNVSLQLLPTTGRIEIVVTWGGPNPDPTLVLYYPFNGNANDESGHGNHGIVSGATLAPDRAGTQNRAYAFDGWNNHIDMPDLIPDTIASFTVSAWVSTNTITDRRFAVYTGANTGESVLQTWNGDFSFQINDGMTSYEARTPAIAGRFVHLVGVYERGRHLRLWLDGVLRTQTPIPFVRLYSGRSTHHSSVGSYAPLWLDWGRQTEINSWQGKIDQVRIYTRALSQSEIQSLYQSGQ